MAYNFVVTTKAAFDIVDASVYYESIQPGLSQRFRSELSKAFAKITDNPQHCSFISSKKKTLRGIVIKGFPYTAVFDINNGTVTVYAVHNFYRRRAY